MKIVVPAVIIGLVGGLLDEFTELHKIWCFIIGLTAFFAYVFIKSIFQTIKVKRLSKDKKRVWFDQNGNITGD